MITQASAIRSKHDTGLKRFIGSHPLLAVLVLAFTFTWSIILVQLAAILGLPSVPVPQPFAILVGTYGFLWAALIVVGASDGRAGIRRLGRSYLHWRVGLRWYLLVFLGPPAYMLAGFGLYRMVGGTAATVPIAGMSPLSVLSAFLPTLLLFALLNTEEVTWRGVALPLLQRRHSALIATLLLALVEGLWHLPYFFVPGHFIQQLGVVGFAVWNLALAIIFTWVYNSTGRSMLIVTLLHASGNAWQPFFDTNGNMLPVYLMVGLLALIAIVVLVVNGPEHLSRGPRPALPDATGTSIP